MEKGDLSEWAIPRMVVVLEGVLVDLAEESKRVKLHREVSRSYHWLDIPLKRLVYMKRTFEDTAIDVVTFLSEEVANTAAEFFNRIGIDINVCEYQPFDEWTFMLRYRPEIMAVYDSDKERLQRYGQKGVAVTKGSDW
jgi:hypothetical protein